MEPDHSNFRTVVAGAGARLKWSGLLFGVYWWLATCLGLWLALFIFDNLVNLPAGLRLPLAIGGAIFSAVAFVRKVCFPATSKQTLERTAIMLEKRYDIPDNLIINAIQFQEQPLRPEEQSFARQTITHSTHLVGRIRFAELWDWHRLGRWGGAALGIIVLWTIYILLFPRQFSHIGARFLKPLGDNPPVGNLALKLIPDTDVTIAEGENLEVSLDIQAPRHAAVEKSPLMVWQEKSDFVQPVAATGGEHAAMSARPGNTRAYLHTFANVQLPFAFRVFAGDSYTRSVAVKVRPLPRIKESWFRLTPPAYTGQHEETNPGPPASVAGLPGAQLEILVAVEPPVKELFWIEGGKPIAAKSDGKRWQVSTVISNAGAYQITVVCEAKTKAMVIAQGEIRRLTDNSPEIDFVTEDRNRLVQYGNTIKLELAARDDFGIQNIMIVSRPTDQEQTNHLLKKWTYLGPPGNPGPLKETYLLEIDPRSFSAGASYYLEAVAADFNPAGVPGKSRPILLRVKSPEELAVADEDPLAEAFASLKKTIASQEKANHLTANLKTYLEEAWQKKSVPEHQRAMTTQQQQAKDLGLQTLAVFDSKPDGKSYAATLKPLVIQEMSEVLKALANLKVGRLPDLTAGLAEIEARQGQILLALLNLLGKLAERRQDLARTDGSANEATPPPMVPPAEKAKELLDDLKKFTAEEEKVLERSKTLMDKGPQDLTQKEEELLGELAREEEKWAKFFEEKLTDFSKLPQQDFADTSLAKELNEVFQEIQQADKALTEKKVELAVPHEQSGLENAKELMHNLERWLPDTPDRIKWSMEEPLNQADVALADLPSELEDIVGELIDKESEMTPDVEDVTSSWMDSPDKGAGWDAVDGPISSMSAKGITGNLLPNQQEVGGRAGEGRTGRSHGQMAADTAEGKGGRETPTRLTPSPFEPGSVKDSAKGDQGGATGGGKLSGAGAEGLRGPTSPASNQQMPRLADRQSKIRQQAEVLALRLRRYHVPTGDLEVSINAMNRLEDAARKSDGLAVRRSFTRALDALGEARKILKTETGLQQERVKLPGWMRNEIRIGVQDGIPKGYEEMTGEYFRALAEGKTK